MQIRRRKSRGQQVADALTTYLQLEAIGKAAKGAQKTVKGTAAYQAAKRTPIVKRIPLIAAGAGAAAVVAVKLLKSGGDDDAAPAGA